MRQFLFVLSWGKKKNNNSTILNEGSEKEKVQNKEEKNCKQVVYKNRKRKA